MRTVLSAAALVALLAACVDVPRDPYVPVATPEFNPDPAAPALPTPIDIPGVTKDVATGRLMAPVPEDATPAYRALLEGFINTLDGWPLNTSITFTFTAPVAIESVTPSTVLVFDVTGDVPALVEDLVLAVADVPGGADGGAKSAVELTPSVPLASGHTYAVVVRGNSDVGVRVRDTAEPIRTPFVFGLLKGTVPLFVEYAREGREPRVVSQTSLPAGTEADIASLRVLEGLRKAWAPHLDRLADAAVMGDAAIPRETVVLFWTFTTQSDTIAQFDPDPTHPALPLPNDLLRQGDRLAFPIDPESDPAAQVALFEWMNTHDGFSILSVPSLSFSGAIDPATANANSVRVFDITEPAAISQVTGFTYAVDAASHALELVPGPGGPAFEHGHRYAVAVLDGASTEGDGEIRGVTDPEGRPAGRSLAMALALLEFPVFAEGASQLPGTLSDADAQQFEAVRAGYDQVAGLLLEQYGIQRTTLAGLWTFTIGSDAETLIDPTLSLLPTPNDLVLLPTTIQGLIASSKIGDKCLAGCQFFTWLAAQGGWSGVITGSAAFSAPLDRDTVRDALHVFEVDVRLGEVTDLVFDLPPAPAPVTEVAFHRVAPWESGSSYFVVVTDALRTVDGKRVEPSNFSVLLRGEHPIHAGGKSQVPAAVSDSDAIQLEALRLGYSGLLNQAAEVLDVERGDVIALWSFTVQGDNEALYSPTTGFLPFPNEILQNPTLDEEADPPRPMPGLLLPVDAAANPVVAGIYADLAVLDGFSVTTPTTAPFLKALDAGSFSLATQVLEVAESAISFGDITDVRITPGQDLTPADLMAIDIVQPEVRFDERTNTLALAPTEPLPQNHRFMAVLTNRLRSVDDTEVRVSPTFWLARSPNPLVSAEGRSLVASLTDAQAVQLEQLRQSYEPMFKGLDAAGALAPGLGFSRESVVMFWTYWTQSITRELEALRLELLAQPTPTKDDIIGNPLEATRAGTVPTLDDIVNDPANGVTLANVGKMFIGAQFPHFDLLSETDLSRPDEPVCGRFRPPREGGEPDWEEGVMLVDIFVPKLTGPVDLPFPVVIFLHGIDGRKEDVVRNGMIDRLMEAGLLVISVDLPLHGDRAWSPVAPTGEGFLCADAGAVRDHFQQGVLDLYQVVRVVKGGLNGFLQAKLGMQRAEVVDVDQIYFAGVSLGAMVGTMFTATEPSVTRAALNVPGAHFSRFFRENESAWFQAQLRPILCAVAGDEDSRLCELDPQAEDYLPYESLPWDEPALTQFLTTVQWILDPADPYAYARYLFRDELVDARRAILLQSGARDDLFPPALVEELRDAMASATDGPSYEQYNGACHAFLLKGCTNPAPELAAEQVRAQEDLVRFLRYGTLVPPTK